jgi:excisionase family DNA binding protein
MDEDRDFLTVEEVASYLRISQRMIRMIPAAELPYFRNPGRNSHRKYHRIDVNRYIKRQTVRT